MNEGVTLQQLADILPPPAPGDISWSLPAAAIVILITAVLAFILLKRMRRTRRVTSAAREAHQRLAALRAAWQARTVSDREAAYRLATLLRLGLALPQLTAQLRPSAVDDDMQWRETLTELHALRYRDRAKFTLPPEFFDRAAHWLAAAQREAR